MKSEKKEIQKERSLILGHSQIYFIPFLEGQRWARTFFLRAALSLFALFCAIRAIFGPLITYLLSLILPTPPTHSQF